MWIFLQHYTCAGIEHAISSDGFFELEQQPKNVVVVGAGYIAVELTGIFNALGSKVSLLIRGQTVSNPARWADVQSCISDF